jgi:hypothetical protein
MLFTYTFWYSSLGLSSFSVFFKAKLLKLNVFGLIYEKSRLYEDSS